jgi:hypothetical protein
MTDETKQAIKDGVTLGGKRTLLNIALVKSYAYCEEYNPYTGRAEPKQGAPYLKQGYVDGFLAGVAYRLGGE